MSWFPIAVCCVLSVAMVARADTKPLYLDSTKPTEARVDDLLGRLTLEEKISLIHANSKFGVAGIGRLNVPPRWTDDGPHGVREDVGPHTWTPAGRTDDFATALPVASCLAATWNPDLAKEYGETIGDEARFRGKDIMLGPAVNISRTPLGGRNFEYMGEDPYLTSRIAVNYIKGVQSRDVASCVKHFALNNQEWDRGKIDVHVDDRALREIYLPAFRAAVQEGGVLTVMGAYNKVRGEHCCQSPLLLNEILKGQWGFPGLVMTDWGAVHDTKLAAMNGLDLEMGTDAKTYDDWFFANALLDAVKTGGISPSILDEKVRRNLYVMFKTKMFDADRATGSFNTKQHQATARKVAEEGIVLLKNNQNILPLDTSKVHSIAVIGDNATRLHAAGGGSAGIKAFYEVSPLDGIIRRAGDKVNVTFSQGYKVPPPRRRRPTTAERNAAGPETRPSEIQLDETLLARAVQAAKSADVAIVIGGLNHNRLLDDEGADRVDMKLPYGQDNLIRAVAQANPNTIVVLVCGAPVEMPWVDQVPGLVQGWYGGMEAGNALAGVLFGDVDPSGKLPVTFPKSLDDSPAHAMHAYPGENGVVEYKEGLLVGYRWFDTKKVEPLFPFGHGLSYTQFDYSDLRVSPTTSGSGQGDGDLVSVELTVTNTGQRAGAETVQLYVRDVESSLPRPEKELKAFRKITLAAGEKQKVAIQLPRSAFEFYDPAKPEWVAEAGDFEILAGSSSRDIRLRHTFTLSQNLSDK